MMTETFNHSLGTWGFEYLIERLGKEIAKYDIAIMIHTARHQTSVRKNAYLFMESLAEDFRPLGGVGGGLYFRPPEFPVKLKIEIIT